jgi:SMODS and SLOG-associating 2TM effector domain 1/Protein of unknown function (DUF4231)
MSALDYLADRQAVWSVTANALKAIVDRSRKASFFLSIGGALAAAIATAPFAEHARVPLTVVGAIALAIAAFLTNRFLSAEAISRHLRTRAASEALKREAYLHATKSGTYSDAATADSLLSAEQEKIENGVSDLSRFETKNTSPGSCPRTGMSQQEYLTKRVDPQIKFYVSKANGYAMRSSMLHIAEWSFALAAAIITVIAGSVGNKTFDLASITAVLTTFGGAVLAHLQASRYDEMISAYRATARRLEHAKLNATSPTFVQTCEDIIADETKSWFAMWSKN